MYTLPEYTILMRKIPFLISTEMSDYYLLTAHNKSKANILKRFLPLMFYIRVQMNVTFF